MVFSSASVSSSGIAIKRVIALILALIVIAPAASAAQSTELAATKKKKTAKITPSPSPVWPPKGFVKSKDGNTYAKIPTAKELVGLASNDKVLTRALAKKIDDVPVCEKFSCGTSLRHDAFIFEIECSSSISSWLIIKIVAYFFAPVSP